MEDTTRNTLKIIAPIALAIGVFTISEIRFVKRQRRLQERRAIAKQNLEWLTTEGYSLQYDEFVKEYNERIEFMNIVNRLS
jgi:hypothetical protein